MSLNRWVLGAVAAGFVLGAGSAQAAPLHPSPMAETSVQNVQFFFFDEPPPPPPVYYAPPPPPVYYDPPPRPYYGDYGRPRREYYPPPGAYYGPPRGRGGPPHRYAEPRVQPPRVNPGRPPQVYTKQQVRAWNRANGF